MATKVNYDLHSPTANMYGFEPCPKCGDKYRCSFQNNPGQVECDACGYNEPIVRKPEPLLLDERDISY